MKKINLALFALLFMVVGTASAATMHLTTGTSTYTNSLLGDDDVSGNPTASLGNILTVNPLAVDSDVLVSGRGVVRYANEEFTDTFGITVDGTTSTFTLSTINPGVSLDELSITGSDGSSWNVIGSNVTELSLITTLLSNVSYTIQIVGIGKTIGSTYDVTVQAVPIPAAVWLFGSALMGLVGVSRRKSTAVAA